MGFWSKMGGAGKKVVGSPVGVVKKLLAIDQARENLGWMARIGKTFLPSSVKAGRVETFDHAIERQGVTQDDLEKIYTNHVLRFWICAIMLFVGWIVGANAVFNGSPMILFPVAGFSAFCLSQMFLGSFRSYQLSIRCFCDVSEWIGKSSAWVPLTFNLPPKKNVAAKMVVGKKTAVVKKKD